MKPILIIILLLPVAIWAQDKSNFSLEEAINYAKTNSYAMLNADDDIAAAKRKVWETTTMGLPQVNATVDYQNFIKKPVTLLPASFFDSRQATIETVEDFFGISAIGSPEPLEGFLPMSFGTKHNLNASATLTQLLFNGSYLVGLQSARVYLEISESIKEKTDVAVKEAVTNAYTAVLMTEEGIEILKKNKSILEKNLAETVEIVKNGFAEEQDAEQLQLTLSKINNELRNMQRLKETNVKMLKYVLGIPIENNIELSQSLEDLLAANNDLSITNESLDVQNHIDFKMAQNNTRANELFIKLEQSKALPSLNAFINYGLAANNEEFKIFSSEQEWLDNSVFGVSLNVPIFSSLERTSRVQQAKIELKKAERAESETEQKLLLQHQTALLNYQNALETFQTSKEALYLAERIEKKENIKFFEGVSSSFELSNAQNQLYSQQQEYLQAIFNLISKKVALETALDK